MDCHKAGWLLMLFGDLLRSQSREQPVADNRYHQYERMDIQRWVNADNARDAPNNKVGLRTGLVREMPRHKLHSS
jgi:hypothetical protein